MTSRSEDDILSPRGEVNISYELPHTRVRNSIPVLCSNSKCSDS